MSGLERPWPCFPLFKAETSRLGVGVALGYVDGVCRGPGGGEWAFFFFFEKVRKVLGSIIFSI